MTSKDIEIDFDKLVEIFNTNGKTSAKEYIEDTYGEKYELIQRRLTKETSYFFNRNTRKYEKQSVSTVNFLSMNELFNGKPEEKSLPIQEYNSSDYDIDFQKLVVDLLKDKMLEINKYIQFDQSRKLVTINGKSLEYNGYKVNII